MQDSIQISKVVRFETFELNLRTGELRKSGVKIRLQGQSFQILAAMLERPGKLVTREALHERLWRGDTFVDFEKGLSIAVSKLRQALSDAADEPRFVETLPRRGYRFIGPVERLDASGEIVGLPEGAAAERTISHYRLLEKLGEGGMGVVYKAFDTKLKRRVALKLLAPHLTQDPKAKARFFREAQAAAAVEHPNICTVYEIDEVKGQIFIAMAFIEGRNLEKKLDEGSLELDEALAIAVQIGRGLEAAHRAGVVHRDIKPANIMWSRAAHSSVGIKILDFGLAQLAHLSRITKTDATVGTVAYMAPEQTKSPDVDHRADIWSLGVLLYEMVTGRLPFQGSRDQAVIYSIVHEEYEPIAGLRAGVPAELDHVISKALAKDPDERYQQVGEMLADLRAGGPETEAQSDSAKPARQPAAAAHQETIAPTRRKRLAWVSGIAAAAVILTIIGMAMRDFLPTTETPPAPLEAVPFNSYPGREGRPAFSPEGDRVAFSWTGEKEDNADIYVKLIGPGPPLRLTTDPEPDHDPAWSPDGRFIAFLRGTTKREVGVFLVPALGGRKRRLAQIRIPFLAMHVGTCLNWSPDSRWLAVCDSPSGEREGLKSLFLLSADSGEMRRITSAPAESSTGDVSPAFSPDGRKLVFARFGGGLKSDLYLLDLGDDLIPQGEPHRLTFTESLTTSPVFTADGRDIVFSSGGMRGDGSLWRVPVSGSGPPQRLPSFGGRGSSFPAISRQGNRLAYVAARPDVDIWQMNLPGADGGAGKAAELISSSRLDEMPRYSPDGNSITFTSTRSGSYEIWKCDADGSNALQLTSFGAPITGNPRWAPDGKQIVFSSDAEGQADIYVVNADGGAPRRLTTDLPSGSMFPTWSRDGKWIYFGSPRSGKFRSYRMPAAGGDAVHVITDGGLVTESADGKLLYFGRGWPESSIWSAPAGGGEEVQLTELVQIGGFDVVGDGIYFIPASTREAGYSLRFLRFATGAAEKVLDFEETPGMGLSVAPDRRSFLYCGGFGYDTSDIMLVENFR